MLEKMLSLPTKTTLLIGKGLHFNIDEPAFLKLARKLALRSTEMAYIVSAELKQLSKITQKNYVNAFLTH